MATIFGFLGGIFGYLLYAIYFIVKNFGVAIIIFTLVFKVILFPMSLKQQKSMAANARLQAKQKELKEIYGNNKEKYNEEVQKLYQKEGNSPFGGCLTSILPMFVMLGIYYAVVQPITNVLHIDKTAYAVIAELVNKIPGVSINSASIYSQIDVVRMFNNPASQARLASNQTVLDAVGQNGVNKIIDLSSGFNFLGLDLLSTPKNQGIWSWAMLIPVLCLVTSIASTIVMQRINGAAMGQQQGCMKYMLYFFPLLTAWIAYSVPCAVGFYWICSTVLGFLQSLMMGKMFSPQILTAKSEGEHIARMELNEKNAQYVPYVNEDSSNKANNQSKKKK